jgi:hypothetical protein
MAFQIVDDILDVEGASHDLGKTAGKDAAAGKLTYPALYGLEASRRLAADCVQRALGALEPVPLGGHLPAIAGHQPFHRRRPPGSTRRSSRGLAVARTRARSSSPDECA